MTLTELKDAYRLGVLYGFEYPTEKQDLTDQLMVYMKSSDFIRFVFECDGEAETGFCRTPPPKMTADNQSRFMCEPPDDWYDF